MATDVGRQMSAEAFREGLAKLKPETPWTHHFEIAGIETITPAIDEKFYKKSIAAE